MYCENCGKELEENASFCAYCGAPVLPSKDNLNVLFMFLSIFFPLFGFIYGLLNYITNNGKPYKPYILAASISYIVMNVAVIVFAVLEMKFVFSAITNEDSPLVDSILDTIIKLVKVMINLLGKWAEYVSRFR